MHYRALIVILISLFSAMLGVGLISPLIPVYASSLGAGGLWLGIIFSSFSLIRTLFTPVVGTVSDRIGRKIFLVAGLMIYSISSLGYVMADGLAGLAVSRCVQGFAAAMIIPVAYAYVGDITPRGREGSVMGLFNLAIFMGFGLGPLMGGVLKDTFSINTSFYAMGAFTAVACLLVLILLPRSPFTPRPHDSFTNQILRVLRRRRMIGLIAFRFATSIGRGSLFVFIPIFASHELDLSSSMIGLILTVHLLVLAIIQVPVGWLADRVDKRSLVLTGALSFAACLFLIPGTDSLPTLLLLHIVMGIAGAIALPPATAMVLEEGRDLGMGSSMSIFQISMSFGLVLGPLVGGTIYDLFGLMPIFYFAGAAGLAGSALFAILVEKKPAS